VGGALGGGPASAFSEHGRDEEQVWHRSGFIVSLEELLRGCFVARGLLHRVLVQTYVLAVRTYARLCGRAWLRRWNELLFGLSIHGLGLLNAETASATGERWFLRTRLAACARPVVFDVGSNTGQFASEVLGIAATAELHCFEPHPSSFARLQKHLGARATVNRTAVGDAIGSITLYDYAGAGGSEHATVHQGVIERIHHGSAASLEVPVVTLATYCAEHNIHRIDLLKIDTEGNELAVLSGLGDLLRPEFVRAIQFEFNEMNIVSRVFFRDFWDRLSPRYSLYRLVRNGAIPIRSYSPLQCELFGFQNIVAVDDALR
jgi:FkbM family methyltransferase